MTNIRKKTKFAELTAFCLWTLVFLMTSCSPQQDGSVGVGNKKKNSGEDVKASDSADSEDGVIDVEKTCGVSVKPKEGEDPDKVLFSLNLQSLPIVIQGSQLGTQYKIVLSASTSIVSRAKSPGTNSLSIKVESVDVKAASPMMEAIALLIAKGKANESAKNLSGTRGGETIPLGQWLNLVTEGGQFKDLLCGVAPPTVKETQVSNGKESVVEYIPGLPAAVSPLAPRETIEKEIGAGREFKIITKVVVAKKDGPKEGEYPTTVSIKPKTPSFSTSDGRSYSSDIAYEISTRTQLDPSFKGIDTFSSTRTLYINTKLKTIDAVVDTTQAESQGVKTPVIVLLRQ